MAEGPGQFLALEKILGIMVILPKVNLIHGNQFSCPRASTGTLVKKTTWLHHCFEGSIVSKMFRLNSGQTKI